jgi:predicted dienelactone hydrolase
VHHRSVPSSALRVALVSLALLVAACGGDDGDRGGAATAPETTATTTTIGTGDGTFTMTTETFVDPDRPTGDVPGRTIRTDVYVPGGEGPFPMIVHNHGLDGSSAKFSQLLSAWAAAGYVVVAPNFPLTNADTPRDQRSIGDVVQQPADVRFVLDRVLGMAAPGGPLEGKVAEDHIGVSGLSLGGATTYPLLFNTCCREARFRSAILMSALRVDMPDGAYDWAGPFPVLAFAGTADGSVRYDVQQEIIANLPGPTWSVTLDGGLHATPFEDAPSPHDDVVRATTLDFWAATLRDDAAAEARIATDATVPGTSSVQVTP